MVPLLLSLVLGSPDLRLEVVRHSLTGTHCRYREYTGGLPTDHYVVRRCDAATRLNADAAVAPAGLRSVEGRVARREIRREGLLPWAYDVDVESGALLRRIPLFFRGKPARVFDPNPVAALNDPSLQDRNDSAAAVPAAAYRDVELEGVIEDGRLRGPYAALVERQPPPVVPPDASMPLRFDRADDGFEDVNAYFHVDTSQRYLQSLGYTGPRAIAPYAIEIDAHAANGADNSFFIPAQAPIGRGTLYFGEGGTDDAEDADLVVHEYAHAILEWTGPGSYAGSFASQARALAEGFGDYWAYSAHAATRRASGRDPFCFADWDARCWEDDASQQCGYPPGTDCLRRLDDPRTMADYENIESSGVEHRNGAIWSSALRELHDRIGKPAADTILLESLFDVPPSPTFGALARDMVAADRLLYGGAHEQAICDAMIARGILATCELVPRGELTYFPSGAGGIAIPDNDAAGIISELVLTDQRRIEALSVRVDLAHPARGDLRIELIGPDGTTVLLKQVSFEGERDIHTTFGLTADPVESLSVFRGVPAAGRWTLRVADVRPHDSGTLLSWGLVLTLEGDDRLETRPRSELAQMLPVVGHLYGVGATAFASDVRIVNPGSEQTTATLIFTRDGDDGRTAFASVDVVVGPQQTVALDDVVESVFLTAGIGSLEVLGDVLVMSRTYAITDRGTIGQQVPPDLDATVFGAPPLVVTPFPEDARFNLGVTETAGAAGTVRVDDREIAILPFSHVQFAVDDVPHEIRVVEGGARVMAYLSQVDAATGDPMFLPAELFPSTRRTRMTPAIHAEGANQTSWRTDLWLASRDAEILRIEAIGAQTLAEEIALEPVTVLEDVLGGHFGGALHLGALTMLLPAATTGASRIRTDGFSQFVPLLPLDGAIEQHVLFVESAGRYRTNIGIVAAGPATAEITFFDAATERETVAIATAGGVAQLAAPAGIVHGRARVRFTSGRGQAYASMIDNGTGDATFVAGMARR